MKFSKYLFFVGFLTLCAGNLGQSVNAQSTVTDQTAQKTGIVHYGGGDMANAVRSLQSAVKQDKRDVIAWYYLGLSFKALGQNSDAIKAFETAAKIDPVDYFRDLEQVDEASLDERLLEVRPQLIAAANSAVLFRELNKSLSAAEMKKWEQRQNALYDFATLVTAKEVTGPVRVSRSPFPSRTFSRSEYNIKLSGNATFVILLAASGKSQLIFTKGYMPQELLAMTLDSIARIEFVPTTRAGRAVSRFLVWTRSPTGHY